MADSTAAAANADATPVSGSDFLVANDLHAGYDENPWTAPSPDVRKIRILAEPINTEYVDPLLNLCPSY